jgi:pimeloyl-ACP methyl ester carboxylesterase
MPAAAGKEVAARRIGATTPVGAVKQTTAIDETTINGPAGALAVADFGGTGPDMLLVHGANRTLLDWLAMLEHLPGVHCVAYDLRGHGRSEPPADGDYGFDGHLEDLEAVVAAMALDAPVIVGHSLGADIAVVRAARDPRCRGIVDIDGFGGAHPRQYPDFDPEEVKRRRRAQTEAVIAMLGDERVSAERARAIVEQARAAASRMGVSPELEERAARRALVPDGDGGFRRRPVPAAQRAIAAALEDWDAFALLKALTVPALSIHGTRRPAELAAMPDDVRGFLTTVMDSVDADLELLSASNPSARVALVSEAGHMVHLEAPATVAGHIQEFLAQL